jgi:hypothetical protein
MQISINPTHAALAQPTCGRIFWSQNPILKKEDNHVQ